MAVHNIALVLASVVLGKLGASALGPPYPVTASWFRDRYTRQEWDETLTKFKEQGLKQIIAMSNNEGRPIHLISLLGGDSVFLRAPPMLRRSEMDIEVDLNFIWCGSGSAGNAFPR